ncbi:MAG TPA: hypothetical protein DD671_03055 [Balneolaceae bacterium]|nr:hypothetical protein [Balneolaceae bacterium]
MTTLEAMFETNKWRNSFSIQPQRTTNYPDKLSGLRFMVDSNKKPLNKMNYPAVFIKLKKSVKVIYSAR